jgi:hypothetical protein
LGEALAGLISDAEIAALAARCDRLIRGTVSFPHGRMPPMPWPLFLNAAVLSERGGDQRTRS